MTMTLDLLHRTFEDTETIHTFAEAREKGILFFKCASDIHADLQGDWWVQVARNWDLNFFERENHYYMSVYRAKRDPAGFSITDTRAPVVTNLLDIKILS